MKLVLSSIVQRPKPTHKKFFFQCMSISSPSSNDIDQEKETTSFHLIPSSLSTVGIGMFLEREQDDIQHLVNNFTAPALARALRERESTLQYAAMVAERGVTAVTAKSETANTDNSNNNNSNNSNSNINSNEVNMQKTMAELQTLLTPFRRSNVLKRRSKRHDIDLVASGFTRREIVVLQRHLHRMPRHVFSESVRRASVVIPLCNVEGVASVLFERRSDKVSSYKQQGAIQHYTIHTFTDTLHIYIHTNTCIHAYIHT